MASFNIVNLYFDDLQALSFNRDENQETSVQFVYTAMHGVGHPFAKEAFSRFQLPPFHSVEQQQDPDPDFSTVKFPNPEEGKDSLDLSIQHGGQFTHSTAPTTTFGILTPFSSFLLNIVDTSRSTWGLHYPGQRS